MPLRWRRIKQEYWADALLHKKLSAAQREFYQGLWMLADDLGYFRANPEEIGAELYKFRPVEEREADVRAWLDLLAELGRIELFSCGHGFIPTLRRYQHLPAKDNGARTFEREHQRCLGTRSFDDADDPIDESRSPLLMPGRQSGTRRSAAPRRSPQSHAGGDEGMGADESRGETSGPPWNGTDSLDGVARFVKARWSVSLSSRQREVVAEVADRLGLGERGFRRVSEILAAADDPDPIAVLIAYDRRLKEDGRARADAQEEESARWKEQAQTTRRGDGFTSLDGRRPVRRRDPARAC